MFFTEIATRTRFEKYRFFTENKTRHSKSTTVPDSHRYVFSSISSTITIVRRVPRTNQRDFGRYTQSVLCFHSASETRLCVRARVRIKHTMSVKHARRYPTPVLPVNAIPLNARLIFCFATTGCCRCERPSKTSMALGRPRVPLYRRLYTTLHYYE